MSRRGWFEVDRAGLASIAKRRGLHFIVTEPVQNAWDEDVSRVDVALEAVPGVPKVDIVVEDDSPDGFRDLADSYLMFRESYKLANPEQRGRFNLGEKLLLSVAESARITSTKGSVIFGDQGRTTGRRRRDAGSVLEARLRMTREEMAEAERVVRALIPPAGIATYYNGERLPSREPLAETTATLETEVRGEEGGFRYVHRTTDIRMYQALEGEEAHVYEMGIPIDRIECAWHVEVMQKVPLSLDRGSIRTAFRSKLLAVAAETMAEVMADETSREGWVTDSLHWIDDDDAVRAIIRKRFGVNAVTFDPSAPESNKLALDAGYTVVHGKELPKSAWGVVRRAGALSPAGRVFPDGKVRTSPDGVPPVDEVAWSENMKKVARYAREFSAHVLGHELGVEFWDDDLDFAAMCMGTVYGFNMGDSFTRDIVERLDQERLDALLIHETAHVKVSDHLTHDFHRECCRIGAKLHGFHEYLALM